MNIERAKQLKSGECFIDEANLEFVANYRGLLTAIKMDTPNHDMYDLYIDSDKGNRFNIWRLFSDIPNAAIIFPNNSGHKILRVFTK